MRKPRLLTGFVAVILMSWSGGAASDQSSEQHSRACHDLGRTGPADRAGGRKSFPTKQLTQAEYRNQLARLHSLAGAKDLKGLAAAGDAAERTWAEAGGEYYGLLMLEMSNLTSNYFGDFPLSQKYSAQGLARADTLSLRLETGLLSFLTRDLDRKNSPQKWVAERSTKVKLWLHAWARLEHGIDRNFNFNNRPSLNITPPRETALPSGVAPEAIRDAKLRAKYEAALAANNKKAREYNCQYELRSLNETFPERVKQYLARVYSEPPYNVAEVKRHLTSYKISHAAKQKVLAEVTMMISKTQPR